MSPGAVFSEDRVYRYELRRSWAPGPVVAFIGLNPSTADETLDDPTIRRCIGFAKRWGYGSLVMLNLFAFRATDPREMQRASDPVGPDNDQRLVSATAYADLIVAAWGVGGSFRDRDRVVLGLLAAEKVRPAALGITKDGHPRHPLYVRADAPLVLHPLWKDVDVTRPGVSQANPLQTGSPHSLEWVVYMTQGRSLSCSPTVRRYVAAGTWRLGWSGLRESEWAGSPPASSVALPC